MTTFVRHFAPQGKVPFSENIAEVRDVAARSFFRARLRASAAELLAAGLRDFSFFCRDLPSGSIAPDPKDSYLLALVEASQADFLVTDDKELLSLKQHKSTRIITPVAMIEILDPEGYGLPLPERIRGPGFRGCILRRRHNEFQALPVRWQDSLGD